MSQNPKKSDQLILFLYDAHDTVQDQPVRGSWWAYSREQAEFWLQSRGYRRIRLHPRSTTTGEVRVGSAALAFFYKQVSIMFYSGVALQDAVRIASAGDDRHLSGVGLVVAEMLGAGHSLSGAMRTFPSVFPPVTTGLVAAGAG